MTQPLIFDLIGKDNASVAFARVSSAADRLARSADQSRRSLDRLGASSPNVRISTNAPSVIAKLAAVAAATKRLQDAQGALVVAEARLQSLRARGVTDTARLGAAEEAVARARRSGTTAAIALAAAQDGYDRAVRKAAQDSDNLAKKTDKTKNSLSALVTAAIAVGPALIPIGVVGAGALAGLAAQGGTALLAILGVKDAMSQGTPIGQQYSAGMNTLNNEFVQLKQLASAGTLSGFNSALKSLQPVFPTVNRDVAVLSTQLGSVASHVAPALASVFTQLSPLFVTVGNDLVRGAAGFQHWAQSSGAMSKFVAYVQTELPTVESTLTNLVSVVMHVGEAFAPFGTVVLDVLHAVTTAIDAIPVPVLQTVVPLLAGLAIGYKSLALSSAAAVSIGATSGRLATVGGIAGRASGAVGALGKAVGFLGPIGLAAGVGLGIASLFMGNNAKAAQADAARVNDLTTAIQNNNVAVQLSAQLQASGAAGAAKQYGITVTDLANAVMRSGNAYQTVAGQIQTLQAQQKYLQQDMTKQVAGSASYDAVANQLNTVTSSLNKLSGGYRQAEADYAKAKAAAAGMAKSVNDVTLANQISNGAITKVAASVGMSSVEYINAKIAADKNAASTAAQTQAFVLENDAASLVNQAFATMAGQSLGNAQAQTAMDQSLLTLTSTLKTNKGAMSEHTTAGLADRSAIEGAVSALRAKATAEASATGSTEKATVQYGVNAKALLATIGRLDGTKSAAYRYAQQLLKIPPVVKTAVDLQADAAKRALLALNTWIKEHTPHVTIETSVSGAKGAYIPGVGYTQVGGKKIPKGQYIPGVGYVQGSASGTNGRGLPLGVSAIGERGAELAVNSGSRVEILSHDQSRAFLAATGMRAPGFAGGTSPSRTSIPQRSKTVEDLAEQVSDLTGALAEFAAAVAGKPLELDGQVVGRFTDARVEAAFRKLTTVKKHGRKG